MYLYLKKECCTVYLCQTSSTQAFCFLSLTLLMQGHLLSLTQGHFSSHFLPGDMSTNKLFSLLHHLKHATNNASTVCTAINHIAAQRFVSFSLLYLVQRGTVKPPIWKWLTRGTKNVGNHCSNLFFFCYVIQGQLLFESFLSSKDFITLWPMLSFFQAYCTFFGLAS